MIQVIITLFLNLTIIERLLNEENGADRVKAEVLQQIGKLRKDNKAHMKKRIGSSKTTA